MSDVTSRAWWRWATGMRTACGLRVYDVDAHGRALGIRENDQRTRPETVGLPHDAQPAPDDPGTLGCLTQRARELWGDDAHIGINHRDPSEWIVCARLGAAGWWTVVARGPTEFAALLAACDAAPVNTKEGP